MKTRTKLWTMSLIAGVLALVAWYSYQHSVVFVLGATEDRYRLWMSALKGFQGTPRYVGNRGDYSYFRVGDIICSRYKAPTARMHLPRTFPLGEGTPYIVTFEMVPPNP